MSTLQGFNPVGVYSTAPAPAKSARSVGLPYSAKEMEALTACVKVCGIDYNEVMRAARSESSKMAIMTNVNAACLGKVVQTTATRNLFRRLTEQPKSEIHIQQGLPVQTLLDNKLEHQTVVQHTDSTRYNKKRSAVHADGQPKYVSADICAIQLGFTSHLAWSSNQVAGVVLLDGARRTTAEGILGMGLVPLYKASSQALFFPQLNIAYSDKSFLDRLQLITVFSDGVLGTGHTALSYSTLSVARHNLVDSCFLPEALPHEKIRKLFPQGIQALKDFQVTEVSPAEPATLTRSFSYVPIGRGMPETVLNWEEDGTARVHQKKISIARNSISFAGLTFEKERPSGSGCSHGREGCPCEQHAGFAVASGSADEKSVLNDMPTACVAFEPVEIPLVEGFQRVGCHPFTVITSANAGQVVFALPVGERMFKNTNFGKQLRLVPTMHMRLRFRLSGSASLQSSGCFYLCYDPNDTLSRYPSRERALMLPGTYFMPGRYDSVDLQVDHLAVPQNYVLMGAEAAGYVKVVLIDDLRNMEVPDYGMELEIFVEVLGTIPKGVGNGLVPTTCLPLGQIILMKEISTTMAKGTCYTIPIHPVYPATDGALLYPSCSSTVLEAHAFWDGILIIEVVFSLPALAGGMVDISISQESQTGYDKDRFTLHGATRVDLRSQRIVRLKATIKAWNGLFTAGRGSIFGHDPLDFSERGSRLNIIFTSPPIITDAHKKGNFWVRYVAIEGLKVYGATTSRSRTGNMKVAAPSGPLEARIGAPREWKWDDPTAIVVRDMFEKPRQFRIASITAWPTEGWLHIPCTPCCFFPKFDADFKGELEPMNYLSHRAQENAMWRGNLKYSILVVRKSLQSPSHSISLVAYQNAGIVDKPSFVKTNTYVVAPVLSAKGAFVADALTEVCSITTPGDSWFWTRYGSYDIYNRSFAPQWLSIRFPSKSAAELSVDSIDLFVEADLEFFHPTPGFPMLITTELPTYYWDNKIPVSSFSVNV